MMNLSTRMRYGTRALIDLARRYDQGPISARDIAGRQNISAKYLEQLLSALNGAGLVRSVRGPRGGHMLAHPPDEINLRQVFDALEGFGGAPPNEDGGGVTADARAETELWTRMMAACIRVLESTTLRDLADRAHEIEASSAAMYHI
ncbi:MAG: RrF2 family transcriptional regulator [Anaerolineae bacterium]